MKIVNVSQMQQAERDCAGFGITLDRLMENAGKAVAEEIRRILGNIENQSILILVGPGNNGGDGLVAARHLHDWGAEVNILLCGKRATADSNLEQVKKRGIACLEAENDNHLIQLNNWLWGATVVLDALFGTGKSRPVSGTFAQTLNIISEAKKKRPILRVIALDLPSGMDADSGAIDPSTPLVDNTITLGFPKIGLFNLPGAEYTGKITVVDIGIPSQVVDHINIELLTDAGINSILPKRPQISHKGTYGKILAVVGSINYPGAAYLACSGAIRVGAGLATLAITRSLLPTLAAKLTEVTYLPLPEAEVDTCSVESIEILRQTLPQYDVLLLGCGLGQSSPILDLVKSILLEPVIKLPPLILDADGLNALVGEPDWQEKLRDDAVFTPHAGELARLIGKSIQEIQSNRFKMAQEAAVAWHKIVVLKGAYTVIASPDGRLRVSPFANPGLASAGTGDVLAGAIAGIAAQGLTLFDAAACGVYLHGKAAEMVKDEMGDTGMLASDLLPSLPRAIRHLKAV